MFDVTEHEITCPRGAFRIHWNETGPRGPRGPQGPQGPAGPPGLPGGPLATGPARHRARKLVVHLSMPPGEVPAQLRYIGGSVRQLVPGRGATNILQVRLTRGTYLVNAGIMFDRSVSAQAGGPATYGYLVLWTGSSATARFTSSAQDAATFTTGPLPAGAHGADTIGATASGSHILVVPAGGEVLNLGAFARTSDMSATSYAGCRGTTGAGSCTTAELTKAGSVVVASADLSAVRVG